MTWLDSDSERRGPLAYAARNGYVRAVDALITLGAPLSSALIGASITSMDMRNRAR